MLSNVLLKKDWKQVSLLWILLIGLGILAYTIPVFNEMQFYDEQMIFKITLRSIRKGHRTTSPHSRRKTFSIRQPGLAIGLVT